MLISVEICAGAGGQALGLEMAGFEHSALVEIEPPACATLRLNRPQWNVVEGDLLVGVVSCPPFSKAGKQIGDKDKRNLSPKLSA